MKEKLLFAENGFVVFSLIAFTEGFFQLLYEVRTGQVGNLEGNLDVIVAFFIIYTITFFLIILRWKKVFRAVVKRKLLLLLVGLALASVLWSAAPDMTVRRSVALLGTTMFGIYFATRYSLQEQFRLLLWAYGTAMVLSVLFAVLLPSVGTHAPPGNRTFWRGIYTHKNTLGRNMGFSLCIFSLFALWGKKYRWIGCAGCSLAIALMVLSGTVSPVFSSFSVLVLLPLYSILRWRHALTSLFFIMVTIANTFVSTLLISQAATLVGAFGRNLTFTGRTQLWSAVLEAIQKRPWFGYGYSAFWLGWEGESAQIWRAIPWEPSYAHNGYLELALQLGLVGTFVFLLDYLHSFFRALTLAAATESAAGILPLAFLTFLLPYNITDSIILGQNSIMWVLYVSFAFSMLVEPVKVRNSRDDKFLY